MNKIVCCLREDLPRVLNDETRYFVLYSRPVGDSRIGNIAPELLREIKRQELSPSVQIMDFVTFAFSVVAADHAVLRNQSADGWTRSIELHVHLQAPEIWKEEKQKIEFTLRFLTGDFWDLHFHESSSIVFPSIREGHALSQGDSVCLLSGGMDSLVGAIDLVSQSRMPIFVSQISRGSSESQYAFACAMGAQNRFSQWSGIINCPGDTEPSTRARSILFFAFALLVLSHVDIKQERKIEIFVPENGFISLNIPLSPLREGSLSTKTTHPVYLSGIQELWNALGIEAELKQPYRFFTKGEMLKNCLDQELLKKLINASVSCGKYGRHALTHCGTCVPCLVRRAAYLHAEIEDGTQKGYCVNDLKTASSQDVQAVAYSYLRARNDGSESLTYGKLPKTSTEERTQYLDVFTRGLNELGFLLERFGVV